MSRFSNKITINDLINIPYDYVIKTIVEFIQNKIAETNVEKIVMGLSGGVDSSTLLAVLIESIGSDKVVVFIMPDSKNIVENDTLDALELVSRFNVKYYLIPIDRIVESYSSIPFYNTSDKIAMGNLKTRIRMSILYYYANKHKALVAGSSDRSEILIGYFTKYGDAAADILPLGSLYKTQVRKLASILKLPVKIVNKPSSPGFWPGHLAEEEIGIKYELIDLVLYAYFDRGISLDKIPDYTDVSKDIVDKIISMYKKSIHKRVFPDIPRFPWIRIVV